MTKRADISMAVRFRIRCFPCGRFYVYKRAGKRWEYVYGTEYRKKAENKLADLWSDFLGMEI